MRKNSERWMCSSRRDSFVLRWRLQSQVLPRKRFAARGPSTKDHKRAFSSWELVYGKRSVRSFAKAYREARRRWPSSLCCDKLCMVFSEPKRKLVFKSYAWRTEFPPSLTAKNLSGDSFLTKREALDMFIFVGWSAGHAALQLGPIQRHLVSNLRSVIRIV